jgi:hypothetical protein
MVKILTKGGLAYYLGLDLSLQILHQRPTMETILGLTSVVQSVNVNIMEEGGCYEWISRTAIYIR